MMTVIFFSLLTMFRIIIYCFERISFFKTSAESKEMSEDPILIFFTASRGVLDLLPRLSFFCVTTKGSR